MLYTEAPVDVGKAPIKNRLADSLTFRFSDGVTCKDIRVPPELA